ncbi:MAG: BON domain-containing protein [Nitrospinota bacterium]
MGRIGRAAALALLGAALSGCVTVAMEVAQKVWETRSTQDQVVDAAIHTGILNRMMDVDPVLALEIRTDVWEGRVLLTGKVSDPVLSSEMEFLVRRDERVRAVYNQVQVRGRENSQGSFVGDVWIETQIKLKLLAEDGVTSVDYRWQSVGSQVHVIGRAKSAKERETVLRIIRGVQGVREVHSFIEVRPHGAPAPAGAR